MLRLSLHITLDRQLRGIATGLLICLLLYGSVPNLERPVGARAADVAVAIPRSGSRHFYLTDANYDADTALTACARGYRMASLWEILDVSNLTYDPAHPDAYVRADSGHGPPSGWNGWVRTGFSSSATGTAGIGNCQTWTSVSSSDYGTAARLSTNWEAASGGISTWDVGSYACSLPGPVWCVGDFHVVYLPLALQLT